MAVIGCKGAGLNLLLCFHRGLMPGVSGLGAQELGLLQAKFSHDGRKPYAGLLLVFTSIHSGVSMPHMVAWKDIHR